MGPKIYCFSGLRLRDFDVVGDPYVPLAINVQPVPARRKPEKQNHAKTRSQKLASVLMRLNLPSECLEKCSGV
jgi:hypothetical protein